MVVAAAVTFLVTPVARRLGVNWGAMTAVRDRDVHAIPTPRLGGIAMLIGFAAATLVASRLPFLSAVFEDSRDPYAILSGAVVITLVDTPTVGAEVVHRLVAAWRGGAQVAVATYAGARRTPVLLARAHWAEAGARAEGDTGARAFLAAHPEWVTEVECADVGRWRDLDTPAELSSWRAEPRDHQLTDSHGNGAELLDHEGAVMAGEDPGAGE